MSRVSEDTLQLGTSPCVTPALSPVPTPKLLLSETPDMPNRHSSSSGRVRERSMSDGSCTRNCVSRAGASVFVCVVCVFVCVCVAK